MVFSEVHRIAEQCIVMYCSAVLLCIAVQCCVVYCSAVKCSALQCSVVLSIAVYCSVVNCSAVYCCLLQCSEVLCKGPLTVADKPSVPRHFVPVTTELLWLSKTLSACN